MGGPVRNTAGGAAFQAHATTAARPKRRRWWRLVALAGVVVLLAAGIAGWQIGVEWAAWAIVGAPNHGRHDVRLSGPGRGVADAFGVEVGPPAATLSVWIVEPPAPERADPAIRAELAADAAWPRGTLLFLHGIRDTKNALLRTAHSHADRGYRGILVDSRGHGHSSGDWMTFGVQEAPDYRRLIDELERRALIAGRLGVYGVSYGAGVAVQLAGQEPRIAAVVAISPFQSLRAVLPAYARQCAPVTRLLGDMFLDAALRRAGVLAHFDPEAADGVAALRHASARVLLVHGSADAHIPAAQSRALQAAAPQRCALVIVEGEDHDSLPRDRTHALWHAVTRFLDEELARPD